MKFIEDIFNLLQNEDIISVTVQDDDFEVISLANTIENELDFNATTEAVARRR